jgi:2-phospho-L-lactate guanylyltransferase
MVETALLAPIKAFGAAKGRLGTLLDASQRAALAAWLAERVLRAAAPLTTFVACDDDDVASWADGAGAQVLWTPGLGLNGAVDDGCRTIAGKGFDHVIVAHGDLPRPAPIASVALVGTVTLVPDRRRDGTNVMAVPLAGHGLPMPASYGPGSFRRHLDGAAGRRLEVRYDVDLSLDVDTPADLTHPLVRPQLPPWLQTILDGRR